MSKNSRKKELLVLAHLRTNARETLTEISKKTGMPVSTIYERLKTNENGLIKRYVTLIDFSLLGFNTRANISIKVDKEHREAVKEYLLKHQNVNSLYKINNGFDFLIEVVFRHVKEIEEFTDALEERFNIMKKEIFYIIDDLVRENFMKETAHIELLNI